MNKSLYLKGVNSGVPTEYLPSSFLLSTWVVCVELLHLLIFLTIKAFSKDPRFFSTSMKVQNCDCYRLLQINILWKRLPLGLTVCTVGSQPSEQTESSIVQLNTRISSIVHLWAPIQGAQVLWRTQNIVISFHIVQDVLLLPLAWS